MNEPVAWMFEKDGAYMCIKHDDRVNYDGGVPLYTHPVKELTDEEIEDIRSNEWLSFAVKQKSNGIKPSTGAAWEHWLAKAILRKAHSTCNGFCGEYECKENQTECIRKAQEK